MKSTKNFGEAVKDALGRTVRTASEAVDKVTDSVVTSAGEAQEKFKETVDKVIVVLDDQTKTLPIKDLIHVPGNQSLYDVLSHMSRDELLSLYAGPLRVNAKKDKDTADNASDDGLRHHVAAKLLSSAKNSLMLWQELPSYDEVVRLVSQKIGASESTQADIADVERAVLFKIVDLSISKMTDEEAQKLTQQVEAELAARGVYRKVTLSEIRDFTSLMAIDLVPSTFSVAGSAGLAGTLLGINVLQVIVLKGIIATSGYVAAGGALLGFGAGGAMMTIAGAAGPIALVLGTLYASYKVAGPAFRKLIPSICVIAAKRIEIDAMRIDNK